MVRKKAFKLKIFLISTILLLAATPFTQISAASSSSFPEYSDPIELTRPITGGTTIYDGAVGMEDGHDVLYTTSKGVPAEFNVIDLDTGELLRTLFLEGAADSWHHEVAPDGTVYVAAGKFIWGYSPETKEINPLAEIPEASLWALAVDEESNAYIGTYPSGKVFKYDKATDELHDYGPMIGEIDQEYVRSMDYHDGFIYAGTAHDQLIKLNLETGEKTDIAEELDETGFVYDLNVVDDRYIFARYSISKSMYIYDIQEEKWLDAVMPNVSGLHVTDSLDDNVYFIADSMLKYINLETLEISETEMAYGTGLRGADWVEIEGDERLPGKSLVTVMFDGHVTLFNIETQTVVRYENMVPPTANVTNQFLSYSDDKIYISGMTGAHGAVYNPLTNETTNIPLGQADVMHKVDGKIYFGTYPAGEVHVLEPEKNPYDRPETLFKIGEEQERLHSMTYGDGKLFVGSIPTYGKLGGALTVYDGETHKVFRNVVQDQSVMDLVYHNGLVYGSTTSKGGLGSTPTAEEAKIFVWDPETEEKINEVSLEIEGLEKPVAIGQLKAGFDDDYIWGASERFVFAMDPETLEIVKTIELDQNPGMGAWNNVHLEWSEEGLLYVNTGYKLYVVNPKTLDYKYIVDTVTYTIGEDGDIYYSPTENRTILSKIEVTSVEDVTLYSLINTLEELYSQGSLPHSLYKQSINQLKQAQHFEEKGELEKAKRHVAIMKKHIEKWEAEDLKEIKESLLEAVELYLNK